MSTEAKANKPTGGWLADHFRYANFPGSDRSVDEYIGDDALKDERSAAIEAKYVELYGNTS